MYQMNGTFTVLRTAKITALHTRPPNPKVVFYRGGSYISRAGLQHRYERKYKGHGQCKADFF